MSNEQIVQKINDARSLRREEKFREARDLLNEALKLSGNSENYLQGIVFASLGQIERDLGNTHNALQNYQEALSRYQNGNDAGRIAHTIRHIADIENELGNLKKAERDYEEALQIYYSRKDTSPVDLANSLRGYAILMEKVGNLKKAKNLWSEAGQQYKKVDLKEGVDECNKRLSNLN